MSGQCTVEVINGVEGPCVAINNYRVAGPKPWGGGTVIASWKVSDAEVLHALRASPWPQIGQLVSWLSEKNGDGQNETTLQLLKIGEEFGETAAAYIGLVGQNPRKGATHTADEVAAELCDVIVTAMVVLHRFSDNPSATFAAHVSAVVERSLGKRKEGEDE